MTDDLLRFDDKVVLITGASRGIGRACAQLFAARGAQVAVHYGQNEAAAQATLDSLDGDDHLLAQADVGDPAAVERMVAAVVDHYGRIDVLVNNAGILTTHPLPEVGYAEWQRHWRETINVNLIGAANVLYCVAHQMIKQGSGGHIVGISSRTAFKGKPDSPAYVASKAGLNAMSQSLAQALGPHHIYITLVAPGAVETDMSRAALDSPAGAAMRAQSPLNRVATAEDVAHTVLFLASPQAAFLTGTIVDVNGASYLRT
ncbi:MAG: SDR family oxidoreductase [Chloroflexi bacterium]|nr:SDR family oxidoreductase [Chloroflexota bacterium]